MAPAFLKHTSNTFSPFGRITEEAHASMVCSAHATVAIRAILCKSAHDSVGQMVSHGTHYDVLIKMHCIRSYGVVGLGVFVPRRLVLVGS